MGAVLIAWLLGTGADVKRPKSAIDAPMGVMASPLSQRILMAVLLLGFILVSGALTAFAGIRLYERWILPAVTDPAGHTVGVIAAILLFLAQVVLFRRFVKNFLVEFAGDVAAYVAPYKVSTFEGQARNPGTRVASRTVIYSARILIGAPLYDEVTS